MWPDEQDAASSSTLSESPRSPPRTLIQFNGGSSASSDDSIENNRPVSVAHLGKFLKKPCLFLFFFK